MVAIWQALKQTLHHWASTVVVLNPQGIIGLKERNLMIVATLLMLIVVIPVFIFTFYVVFKYRSEKNPKKYNPDWDHNIFIEFIWWAIPIIIIGILSVFVWQSSHTLDPYKSLASTAKPITIDVVALDWKWLFIYPDQNIATINFIEFPKETPINFQLTADAPMNSFWIPQLGGQIYSMPGMSTELHLEASTEGIYNGYAANINGTGFAGMTFKAQSVSDEEFNNWVANAKQSPQVLDEAEYENLLKPSQNNAVATYSSVDKNLYNSIIMKFMAPPSPDTMSHDTMTTMTNMDN